MNIFEREKQKFFGFWIEEFFFFYYFVLISRFNLINKKNIIIKCNQIPSNLSNLEKKRKFYFMLQNFFETFIKKKYLFAFKEFHLKQKQNRNKFNDISLKSHLSHISYFFQH